MNKEKINNLRNGTYSNVNDVTPERTYTDLELFAGAGGLALGLEKAGFHNSSVVEWDQHACATLRENRPDWTVVREDVRKIAEDGFDTRFPIDDLDLLSGGAPCQAFSHAGKRLGLEDTRGTLFYAYARALSDLQPRMFIFENVKGLVSHDEGHTFSTILDVFQDCGYTLTWEILNANNYDVAQKRERLFVVGIRNDIFKKQKQPFSFPAPQEVRFALRDVLKDVPESDGVLYSEKKKEVLKLVPPGGYWKHLPENIAREYMGKSYESGGGKTGVAKRLSWDDPSPTLTTSPSQKQTERCHPDETRPLQVREYARIQSFPDEWAFAGGITSQYKQIGNAVPVNLATYLGKAIIHYLNQFEQ